MEMKTIKLVYAFVELARAGSEGEWYVPLALSGAPELPVVSRLFVETRSSQTADGALICIRDDYAEYRPVFGRRAIEVACSERDKCVQAQDYEGAARLVDAVLKPLKALARKHATKTETATTGGLNSSWIGVEYATRSWSSPITKTQALHHLGIGEMRVQASVEAPSAAAVGPLNVRPVHGPDVVFSIVEGVRRLSDIGRRVYRKSDDTLTLDYPAGIYAGCVVKVLNEHGECMVAFGPDPLKPSSTATPRSVEVDFDREVPNRLTPTPTPSPAPSNPRPRCDYARPMPVGEPVRIQWPECMGGNLGWNVEVVGEGRERQLYGDRICGEALTSARDEAISRAIRTLRSLPVCPYSGCPVSVTWAQWTLPGAVLGDRIDGVRAALVCDRCSKHED